MINSGVEPGQLLQACLLLWLPPWRQALVDFPQDGPQSQAGLSALGRWGIRSQEVDIVDLRTEDLVDFVCVKHPRSFGQQLGTSSSSK